MLFETKPDPAYGPGELVTLQLEPHLYADGTLFLPPGTTRLVIFAHGSGKCGPDNLHLAQILHSANIGTLLFDLLTEAETKFHDQSRSTRADFVALGDRMMGATIWIEEDNRLRSLNLGILADDEGAAAALVTAARMPKVVKAIVARSGSLQQAQSIWAAVACPTLLIAGSEDPARAGSEEAQRQMKGRHVLHIIEGAGNLIEDSPQLDIVGKLAADWFITNLVAE